MYDWSQSVSKKFETWVVCYLFDSWRVIAAYVAVK